MILETDVPETGRDDASTCDLSTVCPNCGTEMYNEHAHMRCTGCGYRDSCCF